MSKFSPDMLKPAIAADKGGAARTAKDVALDNIAKQKHLFQNPEDDGKRTFKLSGDGKLVNFTLRVSNTPLILAHHDENGATAEVREMSIPKANFTDALDWYADRIRAGEFDGQLAALNERKTERTNKLRQTRANRKAEAKPA